MKVRVSGFTFNQEKKADISWNSGADYVDLLQYINLIFQKSS